MESRKPSKETVSSRHYPYGKRRGGARSWRLVKSTHRHIAHITAKIRGGRVSGIIFKFLHNIFADNVFGIAAQTAFFLLLSLFPIVLVLASTLARFPLALDAEILDNVLPSQVLDVLVPVIESSPTSATSTIIPIILAVWSASAGIWALMRGICMSHTGDLPNFFKGRIISMFLMLGFVGLLVVSLALWVFGEELTQFLSGYLTLGQSFMFFMRYVFVTALLFLFALSMYVATPGYNVRKRYMIWGALFAAVGWELVNAAFEVYMNEFFTYSFLYGGVGAFIGLAVWLLAISMVILLGAELNALIVGLKGGKAHKSGKP